MGVCEKLRTGLDMSCGNYSKKYYQQAVLVNRSDVQNKLILLSTTDISDNYTCRHRVLFDLLPDKTGFRFTLGENATSIYGTADKTILEGIPQYSHSVNIVILGVDEATKCLLTQLDSADYFVALQFYDGTVEIFGFEYGMTTSDWIYDPQNTGGSVIKLTSLEDSLEDSLPFVYYSDNPTLDFDNNFADHEIDINGDFNDDFNNDFNNQ